MAKRSKRTRHLALAGTIPLTWEGDLFDPAGLAPALLRTGKVELSPSPAIHLSHTWPPTFDPPAQGKWLMLLPWEDGPLPAEWAASIRSLVDEVWVPSHATRQLCLAGGAPDDRVHVVPYGIDPALFRPDVSPVELPLQKTFRFLFLANPTWLHGTDLLVEAYRRTFTSDDDVSLLVKELGQQPSSEWQEATNAIARLQAAPGNPELLYVTGELPDESRAGLYAACQCLVYPYRGEVFGQSVAEAMACGLPVIVTAGGATDDFCTQDRAYLVPAARQEARGLLEPDVDALGSMMRHVYASYAEAAAKARAASAWARRELTWDKAAAAALVRLRALVQAGNPAIRTRTTSPFAGAEQLHLTWQASIFASGGYEYASRFVLTGLIDAGVDVEIRPFWRGDELRAATPGSPDYLVFRDNSRWELSTPAAREEVHSLLAHIGDGTRPRERTLVIFHPPAARRPDGGVDDFYQWFREAHPGAAAYVGYTMFETDRIDPEWVDTCNRMDEVWVASEFNRETFRRCGVDASKLQVIPLGIDATRYTPGLVQPLPIPTRAGFRFLSVFDCTPRKGYHLLLRAFAEEFTARDDVALVVRAYSYPVTGNLSGPDMLREELLRACPNPGQAPELQVLSDPIPDASMPGLYAACHVFVLPSRGEGWGIPYMEAMASGLPTIGTRWSGNLMFMNDANSFLIDVERMVEIPRGSADYNSLYWGHKLAEPSLPHLRQLMRAVYEDRAASSRRAEQARRDMLTKWTKANVVGVVTARLRAVGATDLADRPLAVPA